MRRNLILLIALLVVLVATATYTAKALVGGHSRASIVVQGSAARGRFLSPGRNAEHQAGSPFTISWDLDSATDVDSQDLILSTDGGATFEIKIAAHLPPEQRQLIWSAGRGNVSARARLEVVLRLTNRESVEVIGDDFSILPAPANPTAVDITHKKRSVTPLFAGTGICVTPTLPALNYNLNHILPCPATFGGEPALAQDPNNPSRFHTVTGHALHLRSTGVDWGFSGSATSRQLNFSGFASRQDLTTEVGIDGTVYVMALAETSTNASDKMLIFRSTDNGKTFGAGVNIPRPPQITAVDKPVIAVHPTNAQSLAITFQDFSGGSLHNTWAGICKAASTGDLANPNNWVFFQPKDGGGVPLKWWLTAHPLIDPVGQGSTFYWLFVVLTNDDFSGSCCRGPAGISVFKYQVDNATQTVANGGAPISEPLIVGLGYPLWDRNSAACTSIERQLRIEIGCAATNKNITKAAIDYCDANAHRMYIPTLVNTTGYFADGLTSDLFVTVWTYTGPSQGTVTKRILPGEKQKYVACAATDGHGRVWISAFIVASSTDLERAQLGAIAIDRITGNPGAIAYMSARLPVGSYPSFDFFFMGDYVYTQGAWYSDPNNPGSVNGLGSRLAIPTWEDIPYCGSDKSYQIQLSGWN